MTPPSTHPPASRISAARPTTDAGRQLAARAEALKDAHAFLHRPGTGWLTTVEDHAEWYKFLRTNGFDPNARLSGDKESGHG